MLAGKKGVVLGVANKRSLAWGIAQACVRHGAQIALTYQGDRFKAAAQALLPKLGSPEGVDTPLFACDVTDRDQIDKLAADVGAIWDKVDFVVHSIAFANPDELRGKFRDTTKVGFAQAMDVSCYSLIPVSRAFAPMMTDGGAILALSYLGGERVVPNYNVMGVAKAALDATVRYLAYDLGPQGIRVNALAPGPVKTVSAAAIGDFGRMLAHVKSVAPLKRNVAAAEVGDVAAFYLSDLSRALTGGHVPVDCGYSIMGAVTAAEPEAPNEA